MGTSKSPLLFLGFVMNIFFLDRDPKIAAQYHCDKHVVKMILESAQLLSTAHRMLDGIESVGKSKTGRNVKRWTISDERDGVLYQAGHINHPSAVWVRSNIDHYRFLYDLMYYLIYEYKYRYGNKYHKCQALMPLLLNAPHNISFESPWEDPPQAMPDDVKVANDVVAAYRNYYKVHKVNFAKWSVREVPFWYK